MKDFRAIVRRQRGGEALQDMPLSATTIQAAINEALAALAARGALRALEAESLDIVADGATVETVGLGADPSMT